jgi:SH3-like domain-containing protein
VKCRALALSFDDLVEIQRPLPLCLPSFRHAIGWRERQPHSVILMKRRSKLWFSLGLIVIATVSLADGPVTLSVQVKSGQVRATPSFLGQVIAPLNYGDRLQVLETQGDWSKVTAPGGQTGWVHSSALTKKKIAMKAGSQNTQTAASGDELALAGKGFNSDVEADFKAKNRNVDFTWVDKMEKIKVSPGSKQRFLEEGGIQPAEGGKP